MAGGFDGYGGNGDGGFYDLGSDPSNIVNSPSADNGGAGIDYNPEDSMFYTGSDGTQYYEVTDQSTGEVKWVDQNGNEDPTPPDQNISTNAGTTTPNGPSDPNAIGNPNPDQKPSTKNTKQPDAGGQGFSIPSGGGGSAAGKPVNQPTTGNTASQAELAAINAMQGMGATISKLLSGNVSTASTVAGATNSSDSTLLIVIGLIAVGSIVYLIVKKKEGE